MDKMITLNTTFSLAVLVALIGGVFGLYSFVSPTFAMVSTNNFELKSQEKRILRLEKAQEKYHEHILEISSKLSEIKGELKGISEDKKTERKRRNRN